MRTTHATAAALVLSLSVTGCASKPDYGEMRRARNDRPYRGGAADVGGVAQTRRTPTSWEEDEAGQRGAVLLAWIAALCLHAPISTSPVPSDPPLPSVAPVPSR